MSQPIVATPGAEPTATTAPVVAGAVEPAPVVTPGATQVQPEPAAEPKSLASLPQEVQDYIKSLRTENADRRKKGKTLEESLTTLKTEGEDFRNKVAKAIGIETELSPEDQINQLTENTYDLQTKNFMLETMMEQGIGKADSEYFQFLLTQRAASLGENEELSEEQLQSIVTEVKARSAAPVNSSTSVSTQNPGGAAPTPGISTDITPQQFAKMNITEKSEMFGRNPEIYNSLMAQVKEKGLII